MFKLSDFFEFLVFILSDLRILDNNLYFKENNLNLTLTFWEAGGEVANCTLFEFLFQIVRAVANEFYECLFLVRVSCVSLFHALFSK